MKNDLITAFMIKNKTFELPDRLKDNPAFERGYANGYIAIPRGHELYGKHYDEIPLSVHGGWTFSEYTSVLVLRPDQLEFVDGNVIAPNSWVIGFDTAHFGDNLKNRDRNFVVSELKTVLKNLRNL